MLLCSNLTYKSVKPRSRLFFYVLNFNLTHEEFKAHHFNNNLKGNENKNSIEGIKLPEEPQNCCMSGCANCVWVSYAEKIIDSLNDGGETAKQKILEHVKDPNLRTFVLLELSHICKKK